MLNHALLLTVALAGAGASTSGLDWPVVHVDGDEFSCTGVLPDATRTLLGVKLDIVNLDAFERVLGASPHHQEGDASEYFGWRCWEAANGDGTVLVIGRGEISAEIRIFGRGMTFAGRGGCPKSKRVSRSLTTKNGVRIGLTRSDVERKVGLATATGVGWFDRTCLGKEPMTEKDRAAMGAGPGDAMDVVSEVTVVEADGRAEGFRVVWVESY